VQYLDAGKAERFHTKSQKADSTVSVITALKIIELHGASLFLCVETRKAKVFLQVFTLFLPFL
jgi:hypothetical protein